MTVDADETAAVLEILATALKVVAQAIELGETSGLHKFIEQIEAYAEAEKAA